MKNTDCIIALVVLFTTLFSFGPDLSAQTNQKFEVKPGQIPIRAIPFTDQYTFGSFKQGTVSLYNGQVVGALLNYNRLFGEIQFIHSQGDTLSFAQEKLIKQVTIGDELFYYDPDNGYVQTIAQHPSIKLAEKQLFELEESSKETNGKFAGYYGPANDGSSGHRLVTPEERTMESNKLFRQKNDHTLTFHKKVYYYFIDQNNHIHKASAYTIRKIFSRYRKEINQYLTNNQINFNIIQDLNKLFAFCDQLQD